MKYSLEDISGFYTPKRRALVQRIRPYVPRLARYLVYILSAAALIYYNLSCHEFCYISYMTRSTWGAEPYFIEDHATDVMTEFANKQVRTIRRDEPILILIGSESRLLASLLNQQGIYDCQTPNTGIGSQFLDRRIQLNTMAKSGNQAAIHGSKMYNESHIPREVMYDAYRAYFHRLLTWQNSEKLCLQLIEENSIAAAAEHYSHSNATLFDHEALKGIFPGAQFIFTTSDPKRQIYHSFSSITQEEIAHKEDTGGYYVKEGGTPKKKIHYSTIYRNGRKGTVEWGKYWTKYHHHVRDNCEKLGMNKCKTIQVEDLILFPNNVLPDIYNWLGIETYSDADFMANYDPTFHHPTAQPVIDVELAKRAFNFLIQSAQTGKLDVSEEFIKTNFAQILLTENLYYYPTNDLEGHYFDESGVSFANRRRDWLSKLNLDNTGYSIYSAATYHLKGDFRNVHDFFTMHQSQLPLVKALRSYNLS